MQTYKIAIPHLKKEDEPNVLQALHDVWGVRSAKVNSETKEAIISYNADSASLHDFEQAIIDLGYEANSVKE